MKEKKPFYKRVWFIVLVVLVIGGVAISGGDSDDESSSVNSNEKEESTKNDKKSDENEKEETVYHVGDIVIVGDVEYVVNSISTSKSVGSQYLSAEAKGTFLIVNVTVKNNGNEELMVDSSFFTLINGEKKYESDSTAGIYANENADFFLEYVNPDLSLTGNVVFDVSDEIISSEELQLKVQTGAWGTETELIYLNK